MLEVLRQHELRKLCRRPHNESGPFVIPRHYPPPATVTSTTICFSFFFFLQKIVSFQQKRSRTLSPRCCLAGFPAPDNNPARQMINFHPLIFFFFFFFFVFFQTYPKRSLVQIILTCLLHYSPSSWKLLASKEGGIVFFPFSSLFWMSLEVMHATFFKDQMRDVFH